MQPDESAIEVEASIPADPAQIQLLRSIASALAISLDFDIDTMSDLRMAVDELGATAVTRARPGGPVSCRFVAVDDAITVTLAVGASSAEPVDRGSFGWMVLTTLAQAVTSEVDGSQDDGPELRLSLTVRPVRARQ